MNLRCWFNVFFVWNLFRSLFFMLVIQWSVLFISWLFRTFVTNLFVYCFITIFFNDYIILDKLLCYSWRLLVESELIWSFEWQVNAFSFLILCFCFCIKYHYCYFSWNLSIYFKVGGFHSIWIIISFVILDFKWKEEEVELIVLNHNESIELKVSNYRFIEALLIMFADEIGSIKRDKR